MQLKQRFLLSAAFLVLFFCGAATRNAYAEDQADGMKLTSKDDYVNSQFSVGFEASDLAFSGASLNGIGIRLGYEYGLSERWSIQPNLSLVFSPSGSQGFLYSGFDGFFRYNVLGDFKETESTILDHGNPIARQTVTKTNRLAVGAGIEQLLLNGSSTVYPAAGLGLEVSYAFPWIRQWVEVSVRGAELTANSKSASAVFLNFSILLGL